MKKMLLLLVISLTLGGSLFGQQRADSSNPLGGNINATSSNCSVVLSCVWQKLPATATTVSVTISGTFNATLQFEQSADGVNFSSASPASTTTTGLTTFTVTSLTDFRVRASAYTSGQAAVNIQASGNQQNITINNSGGGTTFSSAPGTPGITTVPISSGLIVENRHLPGENPCLAVDYSGSGNNATGCTGTAPTNIAVTGGTQFNGNGNIAWPAGITSTARSFAFYACFQNPASSTVNNFFFISSTTPTGFGVSTGFPAINTLFGGSRLVTLANNAQASVTNFPFNGCGTVGVSWGATDHIYWNGQETAFYNGTGTSAGQATGTLLLGGNSGNFYQGPICWDDVWNRSLTQAEHLAVANFLNITCPNRGFTAPFTGLTNAGDMILTTGDSIIGDFALTTRWQSQVVLNPALAWNTITEPMANNGLPGKSLGQMAADVDYEVWPMMRGGGVGNGLGGRNTVIGWGATNDCAASATAATIEQRLAEFSSTVRANPGAVPKLIFATMLSRGGGLDTCKNNVNTLFRLNGPLYADYFVDMASDTLLGCDGCSASGTWFQGDSIHWSQAAATNFGAFYFGRAHNAVWGPNSFSSGNTYTATSTGATTITAASCSGFSCTLTMAANPWSAGMSCVVTGMTPAGYNSPAGHGWFIPLGNSTGTTVTFTNSVSGLGVGTVFGTIQCAQELDQDTLFETLGGNAAAPNHIVQTCMGRDFNLVKKIQVTNTNASPWTMTSLVGETFNGQATYTFPVATNANHPIINMRCILTSPSAGGANWQVSIQ